MASELARTKANVPGMCCLCGTSISIGDAIYLGTSRNNPVASHDACAVRYPEEALRIFDHNPMRGESRNV